MGAAKADTIAEAKSEKNSNLDTDSNYESESEVRTMMELNFDLTASYFELKVENAHFMKYSWVGVHFPTQCGLTRLQCIPIPSLSLFAFKG